MTSDVPVEAPPRRSGRGCGYEGRDRLLQAVRRLGAALTKLARDRDPTARTIGAEIAAAVAALVEDATRAALESTSPARRTAEQAAHRLPALLARIDSARERVRHLAEQTPRAAGRTG